MNWIKSAIVSIEIEMKDNEIQNKKMLNFKYKPNC